MINWAVSSISMLFLDNNDVIEFFVGYAGFRTGGRVHFIKYLHVFSPTGQPKAVHKTVWNKFG